MHQAHSPLGVEKAFIEGNTYTRRDGTPANPAKIDNLSKRNIGGSTNGICSADHGMKRYLGRKFRVSPDVVAGLEAFVVQELECL